MGFSAGRFGMLVLAAVALALPSAWAQNGETPGQYKIGVVNIKNVFDNYDKQKAEYKKLEDERDTRQKKIDELSDKITKAKEQYDAQKDKMSAEQLEALEDTIESDYNTYKAEFSRLQAEIDRREKKLLEDLFEDIRIAVEEVGTQGNYHLILEGGESGRTGVLYSSTTLNVTPRVIEHINAKYKK